MIPWELLDSAQVPGAGGELSLHRRQRTGPRGQDEFEIRIDRAQLMNSKAYHSEEMLAELGCAHLQERSKAQVLVGGLGMGFTLERTLACLRPCARVLVAELVPAVVSWNQGPLGALAGRPLKDRRTQVHIGDVREVLLEARGAFDAILLDVDNGPEGLTHEANDRLYDRAGIQMSRSALREGGVLAVWSSAPDRDFVKRLERGGFGVEEHKVHARRAKGTRHVIWLATLR